MKEIFILFLIFPLSIFSCTNGNANDKNKELSGMDSIHKPINYPTDTIHKSVVISSNEITHSGSDFFTINNLTCYWKFITNFHFNNGVKSDFADFTLQLIEKKSNKVILRDSDFISSKEIDSVDARLGNFKDVNFDGYEDFINPNQESSGNGGEFFNVHLYNPEKKIFELSNELSNSDLETDSLNRTLSAYWKSGIGLNITSVTYFDNKGKIKFKVRTKREVMNLNDKSKLVKTIKKTIGKRTIEIAKDTSDFEGY